MNCPECQQPMTEGMCYECGIFFEKPVFEVHDLNNYNVQQKRDYKKLDHFKEVPEATIQTVREKLPGNLEHVSDLTGINITRSILRPN